MSAPQVTPADIEATIASEHYFTAHEGVAGAGPVIAAEFWHRTNGHAIVDYSEQTHVGHLSEEKGYDRRPLVHRPESTGPLAMLTYCVLVLKNGHIVSGEAYCADPAKFNAETGRIEARKVAINKLWPMVIYAERVRLQEVAQ